MIALKDYQVRVLASLRDFFRQCAKEGRPEADFQAVQFKNGVASPVPYIPVNATGLSPSMPYLCLRVPTGGGKTLLGCYAVGLAINELLRADRGVVLWLVPSNTILDQTADALRDPRHAYRRALELSCGFVDVLTIDEALRVSRASVDSQTIVIVATIQSFRVEDTTGRKVYEQNGAFVDHLLNIPTGRLPDLLPGPDGKPIPSLVNMLRLRRPVVVMDEAHNARTDLSFSTLGSVLPACIIEFTATPARRGTPSNVLHHVSAAELKAAEMVKLPLRVITRHPNQKDQLIAEAVALRADLEKLSESEAQSTGEYLRPILLFQAERVDACEPMREKLVTDFGVPRDQIRISVGAHDELKGVSDISSPSCPIRYVITVQKLREGWDCPFAYVLCSVKETRSATAIEQLVGRVLRLPQARFKRHPDLNCAFAFSVSNSLPDVLNELREALEANGFTSTEAQRIVIPASAGALSLGLMQQTGRFEIGAEIDVQTAEKRTRELAGKVRLNASTGDLTVLVPLAVSELESLYEFVKTVDARARLRALADTVAAAEKAFGGTGETRMPSGFEQQIDFEVPLLCIRENGELFELESTVLLEHPWKLSEKDASLDEAYSPVERPMGGEGLVDIGSRGEVQTSVVDAETEDFVGTVHQQVLQLAGPNDWSLEALVAWIDRHIDHEDIPIGESAEFIRKALRSLIAKHSITDLGLLALDRFRLRDQIEARIREYRREEQRSAFRQLLLPASSLIVSPTVAINFRTMMYEPSWVYEGGFQFKKHYFGPKPGELRSSGEEFECAQFIDGMDLVEVWIRNLVRKPSSFRLQTSSDWFYPDFLCRLRDGRILVVEYKGRDRYTAEDAQEKRAVGAVWSSRSGGKCVFAMPTDGKFTAIANALA